MQTKYEDMILNFNKRALELSTDHTDVRLDRIENKIDKMQDAVIQMARSEEKIFNLIEDNIRIDKRVDSAKKDIDAVKRDIESIVKIVPFVTTMQKVFFAILLAGSVSGAGGLFYMYIKFISVGG